MDPTRLMLRLYFGPVMFGPGKADLLEAIAAEGSISAAGRRMGMSYKRAWSLVEAMNAGFTEPLVDSARGGAHGGGAHLTAAGETVLAQYRALEGKLRDAGAAEIKAIGALIRHDMSDEK
ncbi:MAG: LysR family transcriptional regulator [Paracoccaceae bacterium]|nr:LysR family transcriptional regulator [Paracoccaceae bacterium]